MKTWKLNYSIEMTISLPTDTARRKEEPVHEDARAVIVRIIGQQSVPLVLLLTGTVTIAPRCRCFAEKYNINMYQNIYLYSICYTETIVHLDTFII